MAEAFLKQDVLECIWRYNNHDGGGGAGSVQITSSCWSRVTTRALGSLEVFDTFSGSVQKGPKRVGEEVF